MATKVLLVKGMSCNHCVKAVETSVGEIEGVSNVHVQLADGKVQVDYDEKKATISAIKEAIEEQGYDVE
ncbi:copper chaperone CopZ [Bacillus kexueae]|uniref:copper chaperone CopZ n=1 Tax=Aeribacillus kexueae TaxID=2078952 RepID=UPI001FB02879|nr:copper chaperone CopZ [Bacillus kexueae]